MRGAPYETMAAMPMEEFAELVEEEGRSRQA